MLIEELINAINTIVRNNVKINNMKIKINKISLAISHFFGYRKNEEHFDDVSIRFPYIPVTEDYCMKISDVIIEYVYYLLEGNPKLQRRCANVEHIYLIDDTTSLVEQLTYIDGIIYTRNDKVALKRALTLRNLEI
jgi:hypothetical protein